jgi:hypothetical protein
MMPFEPVKRRRHTSTLGASEGSPAHHDHGQAERRAASSLA